MAGYLLVVRRLAGAVALAVAVAVAVLAAGALAGCTGADRDEPPRAVQPGAPGEPGQVVDPGAAGGPAGPPYAVADLVFVHGMLPHHAQALEMTALVDGRTGNPQIARLAHRIEASQADEIARMEDWLAARGHPVDADHSSHSELMPGMLTEQQLAGLATATGAEFDRRFLELMTYHHEGALVMVEELFAAGGGQEPEVFELATHIDADQRVEIDRMQQMLAGSPAG